MGTRQAALRRGGALGLVRDVLDDGGALDIGVRSQVCAEPQRLRAAAPEPVRRRRAAGRRP